MCNWIAEFPRSHGVSACLPLAAAEANINLHALKALPSIGAPFRKFLSEQLKDRSGGGGGGTTAPPPPAVDPKRTYRVRLAVFERARYGDFYKWCVFVEAGCGGEGGGAASGPCLPALARARARHPPPATSRLAAPPRTAAFRRIPTRRPPRPQVPHRDVAGPAQWWLRGLPQAVV